MSGMQQIVAAVGEGHHFPVFFPEAPLREEFRAAIESSHYRLVYPYCSNHHEAVIGAVELDAFVDLVHKVKPVLGQEW